MQTHGWCSLLIKPCVRMTRAVVNTGVTRNPNYDPISPANAMEATRRRRVRAPIVHRHNNETLVSANTMSERCLIVSNHSCVSSDLWTGPFWTYKWIKQVWTRPSSENQTCMMSQRATIPHLYLSQLGNNILCDGKNLDMSSYNCGLDSQCSFVHWSNPRSCCKA